MALPDSLKSTCFRKTNFVSSHHIRAMLTSIPSTIPECRRTRIPVHRESSFIPQTTAPFHNYKCTLMGMSILFIKQHCDILSRRLQNFMICYSEKSGYCVQNSLYLTSLKSASLFWSELGSKWLRGARSDFLSDQRVLLVPLFKVPRKAKFELGAKATVAQITKN